MSFAAQNLYAFMELLATHPSLFSPQNFVELEELIYSTPDDMEQMSTVIASWYQEYPNILKSQLEILKKYATNLDSNHKSPGDKKANTNIPKYELDKKNIINAIQQSSSSAKEEKKPTSK